MTVNALQMNLSALQRQDRAITAITETSPQVTLYSFDASLKQWSRTDIEGSLFVCERSGDPNCCLIILNKKDPRNHKENVSKALEIQVQEKFLLYKASSGAVYGLWFYDEKECNRVAASLQKTIDSLEHTKMKTPSKRMSSGVRENMPPLPQKSSSKPVAQRNGQSSILALLSQAQQRYEEDRKRQHSPSQSSPPQEAASASKFIFSGANSNQTAPVIQISSGNGKAIKILQKAKQSPEHEKTTDSVVPSTAVPSSVGSSFTPFSPLSNRMCPVQQPVDVKPANNVVHSPITTVEESPASMMESPFTPIKPTLSPSSSSANLSLTFASNLLTPELLTMSLADQDNLLNFQGPQGSTDALLSPEALLGSHSPVSSASLPSVSHVPFSVPDVLLSESSGAISPTVATGNESSASPVNGGALLTRDQLRSALITLIQTDDDLITKLHDAYVRRCVYSSAD